MTTGNKLPNPSVVERVISPSHYTQGTIETWDFIHDKGLGFDEGNVVKYVVRHKYKNGLEDIRKAVQYLKHIAETQYDTKL